MYEQMPGGSASGGKPRCREVPVEVVGRGGEAKKKTHILLFFFRPPPQGSTDLAGRSKSILTIPDPAGPADRTDPADWSQPIGHIARSRIGRAKKGSKSVKRYQRNKNYYNRKVLVFLNP